MKSGIFFGKKVIKNFFTKTEVCEIQKEVDAILSEEDRVDYIWKFADINTGRIKRIEYFINHNAFFQKLSISKKIIDEVRNIINEEPVIFKDKINIKYKNMCNFAPHQDICAGWDRYCDHQVTIAIPLCDTGSDNGGICFGNKTNVKITPTFNDLPDDFPLGDPVETSVGDVIFFDSYVPHASYDNKTNNARTILFFTYNKKSDGNHYESYHEDKFKSVPPDISKVPGKQYRSGNSNYKKNIFNKETLWKQ